MVVSSNKAVKVHKRRGMKVSRVKKRLVRGTERRHVEFRK